MTEYPVLLHTALDTTKPRELAKFYRELLGLQYRPGDEPPLGGETDEANWLVLVDSEGVRKLAFQRSTTLHAQPGESTTSRCNCIWLHRVDSQRTREPASSSRGPRAELRLDRTDDPYEPLYVFADPSGHPFCIFVA